MEKQVDGLKGTSISTNRMAEMLAASKALAGDTGPAGLSEANADNVDLRVAAANMNNARPNLLEGINNRIAKKRKKTEGVQGTSPSPGQDDDTGFIPPTTSMITNPGVLGGEDASEEKTGEPYGVEHPNEDRLRASMAHLFAEESDESDDDEDEEDDGKDNGDEDDEDDEEDGKDKKKSKNSDDDDEEDEIVEVHCKECGFEETYDLSESAMEMNPPPLKEGKLDTTCPMCGADMDFSLMGATDQSKVSDPRPFTGPRGEGGTGPSESVIPVQALEQARSLMSRAVSGEAIESLAAEVIKGDFLQPAA